MWKCQECGRRFKTTGAAEKAALEGCPGCGGVDIDLDDGRGGTKAVEDAADTDDDDPRPARPSAA